jgi:hypothetical protein
MSAFGGPPATVARLRRRSTGLPVIQVVTPDNVAAAKPPSSSVSVEGFLKVSQR